MKFFTFIRLPMNMEPTVSSETSAIKTYTPGITQKEQITFRTNPKLKKKNLYVTFPKFDTRVV